MALRIFLCAEDPTRITPPSGPARWPNGVADSRQCQSVPQRLKGESLDRGSAAKDARRWLQPLVDRDPEFVDSHTAIRTEY